MIENYFNSAWRQLIKNKLYASINILGLVVGLAIYVFGTILVDYEQSHDKFFANYERIYTAGSVFSPTANIGVNENPGIYTGFKQLIEADAPEIEEIVRIVGREFLVTVADDDYYQDIRFADDAFFSIFDFEFIEGDERALLEPLGVVLSQSTAEKFFGTGPVLGKTLSLDHGVELHVTGVVKDLRRDSHFVSSIIGGSEFEIMAPLTALNKATEYDLAGNFNNLSSGDLTYILLPADKDVNWLQNVLDGVYENRFTEDERDFISGLKARPISSANTFIWESIGIPVISSIKLLAFLVLVVAIVNYTNLATAQSLGRAREVGIRKTMGARRYQLLIQFLVEGLLITLVSMFIAMALLELIIPSFNSLTDKALALNYMQTLPWLITTTLIVGLVAGAYPAYLITQVTPIEALRDKSSSGAGSNRFRAIMLGFQFSIAIFMLALVMVVFFQNKKVENSGDIYPKSQIIVLQRVGVEGIQARHETFKNEVLKIPGVELMTYSSDVPYRQNNSSFSVSAVDGDEESAFSLKQLSVDEDFFETYHVPILMGRNISSEITQDVLVEGSVELNVVLNELAIEKLGYDPKDPNTLGKLFYDFPEERATRVYHIVGIVPTQNIQGFHNQAKAGVFYLRPMGFGDASIRVKGQNLADSLVSIEQTWDAVIPDYPMQSEFLDATFEDTFAIFRSMNQVLGGFAFIALTLSLIGLFGLAAFMAKSRTREIGIRKVMGATMPQIVKLLILQFSQPVMWALVVALPLSYFAADQYLNFFAERITLPIGIVALAGFMTILFSWGIVAIHAISVARANPIAALRHE
ncbi:MAG: putative ABC transport system permease protein [Candidatus Azotimanducaceae bacterium]|jgi:putative ABC transport system permease protein